MESVLPHKRAVLALTRVFGIGTAVVKNLLQVAPADQIFGFSYARLTAIEDVGPVRAKAIAAFDGWSQVDALIKAGQRAGARLLTLSDPEYPNLLRQIYDPPAVLWVLGNLEALSSPGVAVVGTRAPSTYGKRIVDTFIPALVEADLTVYSGLAFGIDTLAHRKTVELGGRTVAVLGSGIDRIYPEINTGLVKDIVESGGAVITEYVPGTGPDAGNFPARNRIVSGLSRGVFVVESGIEGGSMITARVALDQSRDVFATPHPIDSLKGVGCNSLIRDSLAKLVISPEDILSELNLRVSGHVKQSPVHSASAVTTATATSSGRLEQLSAIQKQIVQLLQNGERHIDDISVTLSRDMRDLNVDMLELEMEGFVKQLSGKRFLLC